MDSMKAPLSRLAGRRDELAKAWFVRLIERASLDEIRSLPTARMAAELPVLIGDVLAALEAGAREPVELDPDAGARAAALASLRSEGDAAVAELARDFAALQAVLVRALREELVDPDGLVEAAERLVEAAAVVQAAGLEELVRHRSRELESLANTDPLTGLYNLRYLRRHIGHLLDVNKRYGHPFGLLLMDVDGLKRVNDAFGHRAGDRILTQVATSVRRSVRSVDTVARVGGDEFCVLAPHQPAAGSAVLGERLASAVGDDVVLPDCPPVSLSIGVVACPEHGEAADELLDRADRAMYRAKATGDNVVLAESEVPEEATNA